MKAITLLLSTLLLASGPLFAQGSLEPPGAPGPTMKTLQQIEPRIPVSVPGTLSSSGSYYLTQNISGSITLGADHITLDLNGFSINAGSPGIEIGAHSHVQIFNGRIQNNLKDSAIHAAGGGNVHISDLTIYNHLRCIDASGVDGPFTVQNISCDTTVSHGLQLSGTKGDDPSFRIVDNIFSNNTFGAKGPAAIFIDDAGSSSVEVLMTGNRVLRSANNGIIVLGAGGIIEANDSVVEGGGGTPTFGVIADNYVVKCDALGIGVEGDFIVTKNIVQGCNTAYNLKGASNAAPITNIGFSPEPWDNITDQGIF